MNRYAFAGGNPVSFVELDGRRYIVADGVYAHSITGKIVEDRSSSTASGSGSQNSALDAGSTERQITSAVTGFIPYAGEVQDATILIFGYDPVSGEKISRLYGLALFLPFVGGGTVRGAVRGGSELIDEIGEGFEVLSRRWFGGGGGASTGKGLATLSKKNVKHILNRHSVESVKRQLPYKLQKTSREAVERDLKKRSFFNPSWSKEQIVSAAELAYNKALSEGITKGSITYRTYQIYGEKITVVFDEYGNFRTAYGHHNFDLKYFGY